MFDDHDTITVSNEPVRAKCVDCVHYSRATGSNYPPDGQPICKRYPPTIHPIVVKDKVQLAALWPGEEYTQKTLKGY
jgi:hypothetical protein